MCFTLSIQRLWVIVIRVRMQCIPGRAAVQAARCSIHYKKDVGLLNVLFILILLTLVFIKLTLNVIYDQTINLHDLISCCGCFYVPQI